MTANVSKISLRTHNNYYVVVQLIQSESRIDGASEISHSYAGPGRLAQLELIMTAGRCSPCNICSINRLHQSEIIAYDAHEHSGRLYIRSRYPTDFGTRDILEC